MNYPMVADLELHVFADDWRWRRSPAKSRHWIGTDEQGRDWLVKMTGSLDAMRERVFDLIAQELGLSCQSCIFITLPKHAEPLRQATRAEVHQGAIAYIRRHGAKPCRTNCAYGAWPYRKQETSFVRFLAEGRVKNATDLLVGNILGYVCGGSERLESVISATHQLFLLDNEYALPGPPDLAGAMDYVRSSCADQDWLLAADILVPKLERLAAVPDTTLTSWTRIPPAYKVTGWYPIRKRLPQFRNAARRLARELTEISEARSAASGIRRNP